MLEFKINFINGVQMIHHDIEELLSAADLEHVPGVNYVTSVAVQDASESYANWYISQIYDRYMAPRDAFDSLFETIQDLLESDVYFLNEVEAAQSQIRGRRYHPDGEDAFDPDDLEDMESDLEDALDDVAGDPLDMMKALLDPEDFLQEFERKMQPFTQDAAELDPAELWKGFGI